MFDLFSSGCYGDTVMTGIFELRALFNLHQKGKDRFYRGRLENLADRKRKLYHGALAS